MLDITAIESAFLELLAPRRSSLTPEEIQRIAAQVQTGEFNRALAEYAALFENPKRASTFLELADARSGPAISTARRGRGRPVQHKIDDSLMIG